MSADPSASSDETTADRLGELLGTRSHDVAVVLGSGWTAAADRLGETTAAADGIPGSPPATVPGHSGGVRSLIVEGTRVLAFVGRRHLYEGYSAAQVTEPVRVAAAMGCRVIIMTNAAGSLRPQWPPGTPVLIRDHLNLTGTSPLSGPAYVDMVDAYSPRLRESCLRISPGLPEGVYAQVRGPQYETPAEIAMIRALGGDLVGMSTAIEVIEARHCAMEVLGISLVTNPAAGLSPEGIRHADVLSVGSAAAEELGSRLRSVIATL